MIAAKIIDPKVGDSTCALGSHRWIKKSGSFTINTIMNPRYNAIDFFIHVIVKSNLFSLKLIEKKKGSGKDECKENYV